MSTFTDAFDDLDDLVMGSLADGAVYHVNASGAVQTVPLLAMVDTQVERFNEVSGAVDRVTTLTVQKDLLGAFDRKGGFVALGDQPIKALGSKAWHIDGIASDDGSLITFYVVP